jgi:ABC-2 type transport system ATP-binding protein
MGQRLGIAAALLGDPATVVLDEPVNGLDPEGVRWIRNLLRALATEGRTVFLSSHLMSEMALTAEHLIVIGKGRLIANASVAELTAQASRKVVRVRTQHATKLRELITGPEVSVTGLEPGLLEVQGLTSTEIGQVAFDNGMPLEELTPVQASLEEAFMDITQDAVEFHTDSTQEGRAA